MNTVSSSIKRNPFLSFVVLTYVFSWWPMMLYLFGIAGGVAAFGPFLAALVVLGLTEGKPGVKQLLGRMVRWRVRWQWYLLALGLPPILNALASYLAIRFGAPAPSVELLADWPNILLLYPLWLLLPGLGGAWEEPGWRGYALHQLEMGRSRLWGLPTLWLILVVWHLPLFLTGGADWIDALNMVGGVILYNWLYHRSGNSVLLVMMIHAMNNAVSDYLFPMFTGDHRTEQVLMKTLVWGIAALIVLIVDWRWWTRTDESIVAEPTPTLGPAAGA